MGYGTGAIMAVPAHDQRDFEFARKFGLPIRPVYGEGGVAPDPDAMTEAAPHGGVMVNSGPFDGTPEGPEAVHAVDRLAGRAAARARRARLTACTTG